MVFMVIFPKIFHRFVKPLEAGESSSSTPDFVGHSDVPAVSRPDKGATMESQWRNGMKGDEKISDLSGE